MGFVRFPDMPTEDDVARQCDALAEAAGWHVERYEQRRATKITKGLPDRRYTHMARGLRVWVELKSPEGKLTLTQHTWLLRELAADGLATCIDDVMQMQKLLAILAGGRVGRMIEAREYCAQLVRLMVIRGYRREAP